MWLREEERQSRNQILLCNRSPAPAIILLHLEWLLQLTTGPGCLYTLPKDLIHYRRMIRYSFQTWIWSWIWSSLQGSSRSPQILSFRLSEERWPKIASTVHVRAPLNSSNARAKAFDLIIHTKVGQRTKLWCASNSVQVVHTVTQYDMLTFKKLAVLATLFASSFISELMINHASRQTLIRTE